VCWSIHWRCDDSEAEPEVGGVNDEKRARDSMNDRRWDSGMRSARGAASEASGLFST
jgi:hypothetical protein